MAGLRVLDLTHVLAGPYATFLLGVLGAEVIKIEPPDRLDCARGRGSEPGWSAAGRGMTFQVQAAGKRSVLLDLAQAEGADAFRALVQTADVVVENYRTGKLAALGLGAPALRAARPGLIHCSITGFGDCGPRASEGAYDNVIQAAAGIVDRTGVKPALSFVDYAAGQAAAYAIAAALLRRERSGEGATISVSMYEVALSMMLPELAAVRRTAAPGPKEAGIALYHCAEGRLMLGAFTPEENRRLWSALSEEGIAAEDLGDTADWPALWARSDRARAKLTEVFATRGAAEWEAWLRARDIPASRVRSLEEAASDPQLAARGALHAIPGGPETLTTFRMEEGPAVDGPAPAPGADTWDVLAGALDPGALERLRASGAAR